jgi:hypothetical protein
VTTQLFSCSVVYHCSRGVVYYRSKVGYTKFLMYRVSEKSGTNGNFIYYLLFTLYALYVHPDALRIFSAAFPCWCGFCSTYWDRQHTTVCNSLPKVTKISDFNSIHLCLQETPKTISTLSSNVNSSFSILTFNFNL